MDPKKLRFYEEICKKENQNTVIYENFTLTFTTKPLTAKFYARHDAISNDYRKENLNEITRRIALTPKDVYTFPPPTVNMQWVTEFTNINHLFYLLKYLFDFILDTVGLQNL